MILDRGPSVMELGQPASLGLRATRWALALLLTLPLILFQRFSSINYPVILEEDIMDSLVPTSFEDELKQGQTFCKIDLKTLKTFRVMLPDVRGIVAPSPLLKTVEKGGVWQPKLCKAKFQVAVIVPFRDRDDHLRQFLGIMHPFLQTQSIDYKVVVVEQTDRKPFNRAKLFNVGFLESKAMYGHTGCLIFHDVDLIPLDARNIYACTEDPRHMSSNLDQFRYNLPYPELFGGAVAMTTEIFEEVNGFSNLFYGWGGEDDDFRQNRLASRGITRFEPHISRYAGLKHKKAPPNQDRLKLLRRNSADESKDVKMHGNDGLAGTNYTLISRQRRPLFTHVLVDL